MDTHHIPQNLFMGRFLVTLTQDMEQNTHTHTHTYYIYIYIYIYVIFRRRYLIDRGPKFQPKNGLIHMLSELELGVVLLSREI